MKAAYLFDIDGTLANCDHRKHHIEGEKKDWDTFFSLCHLDEPIIPIMTLAKDLRSSLAATVFVTGRAARCSLATMRWLNMHGLYGPIYTRADGDHRPDDIVKIELLEQIIEDGYQPIMVFDDRNSVVKAWRARGLVCAHVAEGDF